MTALYARIARLPVPLDLERAELSVPSGLDPLLRDLLLGAAGSSPYLAELIAREGDWLGPALEAPECALDRVLREVPDGPPEQ